MSNATTVDELAKWIDGEVVGDRTLQISGLASIAEASASDVTFLSNEKLRSELKKTAAPVIIVRRTSVDQSLKKTWLIVDDPYLAYARLTERFLEPQTSFSGIHETAVIAKNVTFGKNVSIGPNTVIDEHTLIGDNVQIGAGCYLGRHCRVDDNTIIYPNVSLYGRVSIGQKCIIHAGCILGSDGFGFANDKGKWTKIHQLGGVVIGNEVELGANTCIDCGALDDTIIEDGVKIDNMCHIAHNVRIGENTAIAGASAIAGSTTIGRNCVIGGAVGMIGHLELADRVMVTARSFVNTSVKDVGAVVSSGTVLQDARDWRKNANRFKKLDEMYRKITQLEKQVKSLQDDNN